MAVRTLMTGILLCKNNVQNERCSADFLDVRRCVIMAECWCALEKCVYYLAAFFCRYLAFDGSFRRTDGLKEVESVDRLYKTPPFFVLVPSLQLR